METPTRTLPLGGVVAVLVLTSAGGHGLAASAEAVKIVRFQATIQASSVLTLSSHVLVVAPRAVGDSVEAIAGVVDFRAGARTSRHGEVLLTVEPVVRVDNLGATGAAGTTSVDFQGSGVGTRAGTLRAGQPEVVARWAGPGLHNGRVTFRVKGPVGPAGATVPLRFVLSVP